VVASGVAWNAHSPLSHGVACVCVRSQCRQDYMREGGSGGRIAARTIEQRAMSFSRR
jgi:hypothetical protein